MRGVTAFARPLNTDEGHVYRGDLRLSWGLTSPPFSEPEEEPRQYGISFRSTNVAKQVGPEVAPRAMTHGGILL